MWWQQTEGMLPGDSEKWELCVPGRAASLQPLIARGRPGNALGFEGPASLVFAQGLCGVSRPSVALDTHKPAQGEGNSPLSLAL